MNSKYIAKLIAKLRGDKIAPLPFKKSCVSLRTERGADFAARHGSGARFGDRGSGVHWINTQTNPEGIS